MQYPPIQQIKADLKATTDPKEKDFLEGLLVEMKYDADELNQFYLDVMNQGGRK